MKKLVLMLSVAVTGCVDIGSSEFSSDGKPEGHLALSTRDTYLATNNRDRVDESDLKAGEEEQVVNNATQRIGEPTFSERSPVGLATPVQVGQGSAVRDPFNPLTVSSQGGNGPKEGSLHKSDLIVRLARTLREHLNPQP